MKKFIVYIACLLLCLPAYPLVMFAVWYDKKTSLGNKFNFKEETKCYWKDVAGVLFYKTGD